MRITKTCQLSIVVKMLYMHLKDKLALITRGTKSISEYLQTIKSAADELRGRRTFQNGFPYSKLRGDYLKISEAIGQVMVINGEGALPSSSVNNAPEE